MTADVAISIAALMLGCGYADVEALFSNLAKGDYFADAFEECKSEDIEPVAENIWSIAIMQAWSDVFGSFSEVQCDLYFNFLDSHVVLKKDNFSELKEDVESNGENFEEKVEDFEERTGFEIEVWE